MKKGFTLVEMLVVIGILGILMAVLIGSFSGGTDSARAVRCLTNMKNLASACQNYGMATGRYPMAGSVETMNVSRNGSRTEKKYYESAGWISWYSNGAYDGEPTSSKGSTSFFLSTYKQDDDAREYCLKNGALWKYLTGNRELYVCPDHKIKFGSAPPAWSYVMNSKFRWAGKDAKPKGGSSYSGLNYGNLKRADRILLFAEMPFVSNGTVEDIKVSDAPGMDCDCVLQYEDNDECIGFNHSSGKKAISAHVVFADGHTEKIAWPRGGMTTEKKRELTKWLCEGTDFSFDGKEYKELQ